MPDGDIPNQPIARCVEGVMKRNRKLYWLPAMRPYDHQHGHCFQDVLAYFIGNGLQLIKPEPPQISGAFIDSRRLIWFRIVTCQKGFDYPFKTFGTVIFSVISTSLRSPCLRG